MQKPYLDTSDDFNLNVNMFVFEGFFLYLQILKYLLLFQEIDWL